MAAFCQVVPPSTLICMPPPEELDLPANRRCELAGAGWGKVTSGGVEPFTYGLSAGMMVKGVAGEIETLSQCQVLG